MDDLAGRQRQLEEQIAATAKRRHEIEQRMQSGEVSASRDLQAMDHEVHQLAARQAEFEEEEMRPAGGGGAARCTRWPSTGRVRRPSTSRSARLEAAVAEAETQIAVAIAAEEALRAERAAGLPDELAERYEVLRSQLGGVGAARLVGDRCDGCHLTLPSVEVERIRQLPPEEFATCDQCDRILVH